MAIDYPAVTVDEIDDSTTAGAGIELIDLDAMRAPRTRWGLRKAIARDLDRFIANWKDSATIRAALTRAFAPLTANAAPRTR